MSEIQHGECALKVDGLRVGYGDLVAVWDGSLEVYAGKTTALVGRNGAGKTTLLGGIAGLLPAKSGSVTLLGQDVSRLPSWRRVSRGLSLVQEGKRVFRKITVRENLVLGLRARRVRRMQIDSELDKIYERFPVLAERRGAVAGSLSGGQQQMLAIGTALAADPKVILVDEPSSGLAPVFADRVFEVLDALRNEGMAILLVEQLVEEVLQGTADHVVVLEQGRVTLSDEAANVSADAVARSIYASA